MEGKGREAASVGREVWDRKKDTWERMYGKRKRGKGDWEKRFECGKASLDTPLGRMARNHVNADGIFEGETE